MVSARAPLASRAQLGRELSLAQQRIETLEAQLSQLSRQKELLLRELNHRVGNNLAVLLGILDRERAAEQSGTSADASLKLSRFVLALAVVQRLLSETGWRPLRLALLCRAVLESATSGVAPAARVRVADSSIEVPSRVADSIAVVLSELALNSLKHCGDRESLNIGVHLQARGGLVVFEYRDSGPGYPSAILGGVCSAGGLGLVSEVARHGLGGRLELSNDPGATAMLTFAHSGSARSAGTSQAGDAARGAPSSSRG